MNWPKTTLIYAILRKAPMKSDILHSISCEFSGTFLYFSITYYCNSLPKFNHGVQEALESQRIALQIIIMLIA